MPDVYISPAPRQVRLMPQESPYCDHGKIAYSTTPCIGVRGTANNYRAKRLGIQVGGRIVYIYILKLAPYVT